LKAQGVAHGDHQLPDPQRIGIAELGKRQVAGRQPQDGKVGERIVADHFRVQAVAFPCRGSELAPAVHDVAVGQGVAVRRDQEAGTLAALAVVARADDADDRRRHVFDDGDDGLRVGVEQVTLVGVVGRLRLTRRATLGVGTRIRMDSEQKLPSRMAERLHGSHLGVRRVAIVSRRADGEESYAPGQATASGVPACAIGSGF
jgi:hypothetical protein